jgi:hypothetical protein
LPLVPAAPSATIWSLIQAHVVLRPERIHGVVTVSASYAHWAGDVFDRKVLALETHRDLSELVHVNHLISAQVEWLMAI